MQQTETSSPRPVGEVLSDVVSTSRQLLFKRLDLFQLEAEGVVDSVATRVFEGCIAIILATLSLVSGSVGLVLWLTPQYGMAEACGMVAGGYAVISLFLMWSAQRRRSASVKEVLQ